MFGSVLMVLLGVAIHRVSYQRRSEVKEIAVTSRCVTAEDSMIPRFHERRASTDRYVYLLECQTRPQCITGRRTKQDEKEDTIVKHTITIPLLPHSSTPTKLSIQCDPTDMYPRSIDIAFVFADHTTATTQYWISNLPSKTHHNLPPAPSYTHQRFTPDAVDRQQHPGNALPLSLPIQSGHSHPPTVAVLSATPTLTALSLRILVCLLEVVVVLFSLPAVPLFGSVVRLRTLFSFFFSLPLTTRAFGKTASISSSERGVSLFDLSCMEPA
jgi:hypothetical protein